MHNHKTQSSQPRTVPVDAVPIRFRARTSLRGGRLVMSIRRRRVERRRGRGHHTRKVRHPQLDDGTDASMTGLRPTDSIAILRLHETSDTSELFSEPHQ